ncbi:MAG: MGMT family protein [Spirochaetales bacterium]|nr:MGMT family protein [Spirochaetales bacterium]
MEEFSLRVIEIIRSIPEGKVSSYGRIAVLAGAPRGARQVARLLHSSSRKHNMPWHRVVNSSGGISLEGDAGQIQRGLLEAEGVEFTTSGKVKLSAHLWEG